MKAKNDTPFQPVGTSWSTWIPAGMTIEVYISPDGNSEHFSRIGGSSTIAGPNTFQCSGFNQNSFFKLKGLGDQELNILV